MFDNGLFFQTKSDCFFNSRTKYYIGSDGALIPYEMMVCSRQVFSDGGNELSDFSRSVQERLDYIAAAVEIFGDKPVTRRGYEPRKATKQELLDSSRRRARRKIFDYCICNDFDLFVTLTLDGSLIDRGDYSAVIKKLTNFLGNRVKRRGLKYIGVPEYHKNGGIHFHFLTTSCGFRLVDSGTVSVEGKKKPIKVSTAKRQRIPESEWHTVYNVADWELGFSTAIFTYGSRGAVAQYMSKELCKSVQKSLVDTGSIDKIGGRWYYHGGDLKKPVVMYDNVNYAEMGQYSYDLHTDGGSFKVYKFNENGDVLK